MPFTRKMVNRLEPTPSLAEKITSGVELFGSMKSAWDVGRQVVDAARIASPYIARGIAAVL